MLQVHPTAVGGGEQLPAHRHYDAMSSEQRRGVLQHRAQLHEHLAKVARCVNDMRVTTIRAGSARGPSPYAGAESSRGPSQSHLEGIEPGTARPLTGRSPSVSAEAMRSIDQESAQILHFELPSRFLPKGHKSRVLWGAARPASAGPRPSNDGTTSRVRDQMRNDDYEAALQARRQHSPPQSARSASASGGPLGLSLSTGRAPPAWDARAKEEHKRKMGHLKSSYAVLFSDAANAPDGALPEDMRPPAVTRRQVIEQQRRDYINSLLVKPVARNK